MTLQSRTITWKADFHKSTQYFWQVEFQGIWDWAENCKNFRQGRKALVTDAKICCFQTLFAVSGAIFGSCDKVHSAQKRQIACQASTLIVATCLQIGPYALSWRQISKVAVNMVQRRMGYPVKPYAPVFSDGIDIFLIHAGEEHQWPKLPNKFELFRTWSLIGLAPPVFLSHSIQEGATKTENCVMHQQCLDWKLKDTSLTSNNT